MLNPEAKDFTGCFILNSTSSQGPRFTSRLSWPILAITRRSRPKLGISELPMRFLRPRRKWRERFISGNGAQTERQNQHRPCPDL